MENEHGGGVVMMASLRSKNKNKTFKHSMSGPIPKKIVFDAGPSTATYSQPEADVSYTSSGPRLITPSEKQDNGELPPNMFVTSIDVEEGMWGGKKGKGKKKWEKENVELEYGDAEPDSSFLTEFPKTVEPKKDSTCDSEMPTDSVFIAKHFDWAHAEAQWDKFADVTSPQQLPSGTLVGWKVRYFISFTVWPLILCLDFTVSWYKSYDVQPRDAPHCCSYI